MKIPKADVIALTGLLSDFEKMCMDRGIRFNRYSEDQLWEFILFYKSYRQHPPESAPF